MVQNLGYPIPGGGGMPGGIDPTTGVSNNMGFVPTEALNSLYPWMTFGPNLAAQLALSQYGAQTSLAGQQMAGQYGLRGDQMRAEAQLGAAGMGAQAQMASAQMSALASIESQRMATTGQLRAVQAQVEADLQKQAMGDTSAAQRLQANLTLQASLATADNHLKNEQMKLQAQTSQGQMRTELYRTQMGEVGQSERLQAQLALQAQMTNQANRMQVAQLASEGGLRDALQARFFTEGMGQQPGFGSAFLAGPLQALQGPQVGTSALPGANSPWMPTIAGPTAPRAVGAPTVAMPGGYTTPGINTEMASGLQMPAMPGINVPGVSGGVGPVEMPAMPSIFDTFSGGLGSMGPSLGLPSAGNLFDMGGGASGGGAPGGGAPVPSPQGIPPGWDYTSGIPPSELPPLPPGVRGGVTVNQPWGPAGYAKGTKGAGKGVLVGDGAGVIPGVTEMVRQKPGGGFEVIPIVGGAQYGADVPRGTAMQRYYAATPEQRAAGTWLQQAPASPIPGVTAPPPPATAPAPTPAPAPMPLAPPATVPGPPPPPPPLAAPAPAAPAAQAPVVVNVGGAEAGDLPSALNMANLPALLQLMSGRAAPQFGGFSSVDLPELGISGMKGPAQGASTFGQMNPQAQQDLLTLWKMAGIQPEVAGYQMAASTPGFRFSAPRATRY